MALELAGRKREEIPPEHVQRHLALSFAITNAFEAEAFCLRVEETRRKRVAEEKRIDTRDKTRCPACVGSGFVASDEPYMMMQAVPCRWCQ